MIAVFLNDIINLYFPITPDKLLGIGMTLFLLFKGKGQHNRYNKKYEYILED